MIEPDPKLVHQCLLGETEAFGTLYDRHALRVHRLLVRLTGDLTDAEDLTQETFVTAYRSLRSWRQQGAFHSWLYGIAVRVYRARMRRPQLVETQLLDDMLADSGEHGGGGDPLDVLTQQEGERLLEAAIRDLPDVYRMVFVLLRVEGVSQREAAEMLEIPIGTVQSRLWRAVCLLRKRLSEQGVGGHETGSLKPEGGGRDAMQFRA